MIKQNKYGGYVEVGGAAYWTLFILVYIILIGFDIFIITDTFKNKNKIKLLSSYIKDKESELEKLQEKFNAFEMNISSVDIYNYKQKFREKHDMLLYRNNPPLNVNWNELLSNPEKYRKKRIIPSDQIFIWSTTSESCMLFSESKSEFFSSLIICFASTPLVIAFTAIDKTNARIANTARYIIFVNINSFY